jgi:TIGR03009 family protein
MISHHFISENEAGASRMTRTFVGAAVLVALVAAPLAAQTSPPAGSTTPSSRYKLGLPPKTSTQQTTQVQTQPAAGSKPVLGPVAPARRTTTDKNVRPAADTQPIREPASGQLPPRRPAAGANPGAQPPVDAPPQPPSWFPLDEATQKFVDNVLAHWEQTSDKVEYYECTFQKWHFDPIFGPKDPRTPRFFSKGEIKYQSPDKGLFRDVTVWEYVGLKPGEEDSKEKPKAGEPPPGWRDALELVGEHWVSDGKTIFQYDSKRKRVLQTIIPEEMQGKAIADGPLPFLFGAKAAAIKQRYWIRPLEPPAGVKNEYWLEAVPRSRQDAQNFQKVVVVLAKEDFVPSKLSVYPPNHDPKKNPVHQDYTFANRNARLTGDFTLKDLQFWKTHFYEPKVPKGWTKEPPQRLGAPAPVAAGPRQPLPQARQPKTGVKTK